VGRYLRLAALAVGVLLYLWVAATRRAGEVKSRKASRRLSSGA
jgi:hypothetical protein